MNFHRWFAVVAASVVSAAVCFSAGQAVALDRDLAYLHALQSRGFGDVAVNYLETLEKKNEVSPAVRGVFDLEMSKSLRAEAQSLPIAAQRGAVLARSQKYLDQFVKNNPNHPDALQAQIASAEMMFDHAQETLSDSRSIADKVEKANSLTQARGELTQVKTTLKPAVDKLIEQLKAIGPRPTRMFKGQRVLKEHQAMTKKERDQEARRVDLEFDLIRTSGELALVDYFRAQTYTDPASADRKLALNTAAKALDNYYQLHRGNDPLSLIGRSGFIGAQVAHTWYGKAVEELNDLSQAKDVYDEVLGNFPDPPAPNAKEEPTGVEEPLARAKFYSLQLLAKDPKQQKAFMDQAKDFLSNYKKLFRVTWGYQATSFDVAKRMVAAAEKETNAKAKAVLLKDALLILKDMTSVRSEFQEEATKLRLSISAGAKPTNVDDAIEYIALAYKEKNWAKVEALCQTGLELLKKSGKKEVEIKALQGKFQDWLAESQIWPMFEDFDKNREPFKQEKYVEWLDKGEAAAKENKKSSVIAPKAGSFAVYCAAVLYGKARDDEQHAKTPAAKKAAAADKAKASDRLQEVADFMITSFPNSSEADEAKLSLAKAKWSDGNLADAITAFESISPKSEKHAEALRLAGSLRVEQFQTELRKPADKQDKALVEKLRAAAVKALAESIKEQTDLHKPNDPYPPALIKTQLLLAKVHMQAKDYAEALKVLQPLIAAANAANDKKTPLDETMLDIFSQAVRAYMATDDYQKAGAAGSTLIDLGPDQPKVNAVLVDFVRRLDIELKDLRDKRDKLADASSRETESLRARISSIQEMMGTMVTKLAQRKEMEPKTMVFLGSLFMDIGDFKNAKDEYRKVQDLPGVNPKLGLWVGAQLVDILGKEGQFEKATDEIERLRGQKPNNLDFMVVEAQLWQDWGEKDPAKYDTAIQKWVKIRLRMQHQKSSGTAYYDSVYNAAFCCLRQANKWALNPSKLAEARKRAVDGSKILKSEVQLNPRLNGPATVKRFKDLQADLDKLHKKLNPAAA